LTERLHLGAAQFVDRRGPSAALDRVGNRPRHVADENGSEPAVAAAYERQRRQEAGKSGKPIEEMIFGPEDDRGPHDGGMGDRFEDRLFALRLAAAVGGRRFRIGADRRDVDQTPDPGSAGRLGDGTRAEDVDGIKPLATGFGEHRDEIDDGVRPFDRPVDRPAIAKIGLNWLDPADHAERLEVTGEIGSADGGANPPAALQERAHDMTADETGAAEDRH